MEIFALALVVALVGVILYGVLLSTTAFRDGVKETNRDAQLMAEIEKLNEALTYSASELATLRLDLAVTTDDRNDLLEVARTTLGYVSLSTGNGLDGKAPFGEKIPEWFGENEKNQVSFYDGWTLIRKDLEAVLPRV